MSEEATRFNVDEGLSALESAEKELCKPADNIIITHACQCARTSVSRMLRAFLSGRRQDGICSRNISTLASQCAALDEEFGRLDLSCFTCSDAPVFECESKYCFSIEHVKQCCEKAISVKDLVLKKLNPG